MGNHSLSASLSPSIHVSLPPPSIWPRPMIGASETIQPDFPVGTMARANGLTKPFSCGRKSTQSKR